MIATLLRSSLFSLAIVACTSPVMAEGTTATGASKAMNDANFRQQFAQGFNKGCLAGRTPGVANQAEFCSCMANAYTTRFNGKTLALISQLAGKTANTGPQLVDAMMTPERLACVNKTAVGKN